MVLKIALSGTHCSGKTTTTQLLQERLVRCGVKAAYGLEIVRECPYLVNEAGSERAQLWIMLAQIVKELGFEKKADVVVLDRCVFDNLPYSKWLQQNHQLRKSVYDYLKRMALEWAKLYPYTIIFVLDPLPLVDDGFRSVNLAYQNEVQTMLIKLYSELGGELPNTRIIKIGRVTNKTLNKMVKIVIKEINRHKHQQTF